MELAVFRRAVGWVVGRSLSLLEEFRESQENGLVNLRVGGGGAAVDKAGAGGGTTAEWEGFGLREESLGGGDQGMEGRALVMLLRDSFLSCCSLWTGLLGSKETIS